MHSVSSQIFNGKCVATCLMILEKNAQKLASTTISNICGIKEVTLEFHACQVNGKKIAMAE